FDLDLDSLVARFNFAGDLFNQSIGAWLQSDRNSACYLAALSSNVLPEGLSGKSGFEFPDRSFNATLGHSIAAYAGQRSVYLLSSFDTGTCKNRGHKIGH